MPTPNTFTIGPLAAAAGIPLDTIRYYEKRGLMPKPARRAGTLRAGYRQYGSSDLARLRFIRHAQELGFSLREIKSLLELRVDPKTTCADVKRKAMDKIADLERKLRVLQEVKRALERLAAACSGRGPGSDCPILDAFEAREAGPDGTSNHSL